MTLHFGKIFLMGLQGVKCRLKCFKALILMANQTIAKLKNIKYIAQNNGKSFTNA